MTMPHLYLHWKKATLILVSTLIFGCAHTQDNIDEASEFSGYLSDYSNLKQIDDSHYRWISDSFDGKNYSKVYFEDVEVYTTASSPEQEKALAEVIPKATAEFNKVIRTELSKNHELVNQSGPGVLHLKSAFTSSASQAIGMTGWEIMPVSAVIGGSMAASGVRPRVVQLVWELKAFDGGTGELVATGVKKGQADQESYQQVTLEDFLQIINQFAKISGERLNKLLE